MQRKHSKYIAHMEIQLNLNNSHLNTSYREVEILVQELHSEITLDWHKGLEQNHSMQTGYTTSY